MAIALRAGVKATVYGYAVASRTLAYAGATSIGDLMIVTGTSWASPADTAVTISDNVNTGNYTVKFYLDAVNGNRASYIGYKIANAAGTPTVTVDPDSATNYMAFSVSAFTGAHATVPLDVDDGYVHGNDATPTQSITVAADTLIIGVVCNDSLFNFTPGSNYTEIGEDYNSEGYNGQYRVITTAGAYDVNWTQTSGSWTTQVASFAPAAAAAGAVRKSLICNQAVNRASTY